MQIVELLVAADRVHIGVEPLADVEIIVLQGEALPFREGMNDLRVASNGGDVKADRTLDTVEVVVQTGVFPHEKRSGDAAEIELDREIHLEGALDRVDRELGLVDGEFRFVVFGNDKHGRRPFAFGWMMDSGGNESSARCISCIFYH